MGATAIQIDMATLTRWQEAWGRAPEAMLLALTAASWQAELLIQREVVERTPTSGHGTLRQSIAAQEPEVLADAVIGVVGTALAYAIPVELGSKPHMPPLTPLVDWVEQKLGLKGDEATEVAEKIRWKIKAHGTPAVHMFRDGFAAVQSQVTAIYAQAAESVLAGLA